MKALSWLILLLVFAGGQVISKKIELLKHPIMR